MIRGRPPRAPPLSTTDTDTTMATLLEPRLPRLAGARTSGPRTSPYPEDGATASRHPVYAEALAAIDRLLREAPALRELRNWGFAFTLTADTECLLAEARVSRAGSWPVLTARITDRHWWHPADEAQYRRLATRIAAEAHLQWERWMAGPGA